MYIGRVIQILQWELLPTSSEKMVET